MEGVVRLGCRKPRPCVLFSNKFLVFVTFFGGTAVGSCHGCGEVEQTLGSDRGAGSRLMSDLVRA